MNIIELNDSITWLDTYSLVVLNFLHARNTVIAFEWNIYVKIPSLTFQVLKRVIEENCLGSKFFFKGYIVWCSSSVFAYFLRFSFFIAIFNFYIFKNINYGGSYLFH